VGFAVSPWRRAPRALYRVYGEDEYLAGEDEHDADAAAGEIPAQMDARRSGRLLGLGLLVCVTASALGLVALHLLDSRSSATATVAVHGNRVGNGGASATEHTSATPAAVATPFTPATRSAPAFASPHSRPIARRPGRLAHAQPTPLSRASSHMLEHGLARPTRGEAIAEDEFGFER
jgi:hypothetical protein